MNKQKLNGTYGLHLNEDEVVCEGDYDSTTAFLRGAILGYCQSHEWYDQTPAFYFTKVVKITASLTEDE